MNYPDFRHRRFKWAFPFLLLFPVIVLLIGLIVMILWNAILPQVIHVESINYLQALGILILSRILMGGFSFFSRPWHRPSSGLREKWMNMSDEEKEKFREEWKKRCN